MMYGGIRATIWSSALRRFCEEQSGLAGFQNRKKSSFKAVAAWRSCSRCRYPWHKLWAYPLRRAGAPKDMGRGIGQGVVVRPLKSSSLANLTRSLCLWEREKKWNSRLIEPPRWINAGVLCIGGPTKIVGPKTLSLCVFYFYHFK